MMGRQTSDQSRLFYSFNLEERIPECHLLRRIDPVVTDVLSELRVKLRPFYSEIGRPSIDPELMLRMLIIGYCYGIRFERKLCEDVELHLAYLAVSISTTRCQITRPFRSIATAASATVTFFDSCSRR